MGKKKKILVADDDTAILEVITFMLEDASYEVKTTVNGQTKQIVQEYLPNLILLDIWMAGTDGRSICKELKSQVSTKHIPIIMISASRDIGQSALNAGAEDFIAKPFEMEDLLSKVAHHVK